MRNGAARRVKPNGVALVRSHPAMSLRVKQPLVDLEARAKLSCNSSSSFGDVWDSGRRARRVRRLTSERAILRRACMHQTGPIDRGRPRLLWKPGDRELALRALEAAS